MSNAIAGLAPCVHCGLCLQSCPTYVATGDEADGPRGRIVLMLGLARGDLDPSDPKVAHHLNRCLGCRACESACPSGVLYGPALEESRSTLVKSKPLGLIPRIVLAVMADRRLRGPVFALSRWFRPLARLIAGRSPIGFQMAMLAATRMPLDQLTKDQTAPSIDPRPHPVDTAGDRWARGPGGDTRRAVAGGDRKLRTLVRASHGRAKGRLGSAGRYP